MNSAEFKACCLEIFKENGLPIPNEEQAEKLFLLTERMLEVNKSMNLTAITEPRAVILKHYADSVSISRYIKDGACVADVGCGAGFPTLPLAIMRSDISFLAVDSTAKRIDYVKKTAELLGLPNVKAVAARAEELGRDSSFRESFDYVTARAVASLPVLSELCLPLVKKGGRFIAMKASQGGEELALAENAISLCGGQLDASCEISLLDIGQSLGNRTIILISKLSDTPQKYPRHFSQISKKPL